MFRSGFMRGVIVKKAFRLRKKRDFNIVYKWGKAVTCNYMVLIYVKSKSSITKVGFSVSKKIGKSVVRNRVKRLMKESYRLISENSENIEKGYNLVFVARNASNSADYSEIKRSMLYLLHRSQLLKKGIG